MDALFAKELKPAAAINVLKATSIKEKQGLNYLLPGSTCLK
jgi:hypothetical protein